MLFSDAINSSQRSTTILGQDNDFLTNSKNKSIVTTEYWKRNNFKETLNILKTNNSNLNSDDNQSTLRTQQTLCTNKNDTNQRRFNFLGSKKTSFSKANQHSFNDALTGKIKETEVTLISTIK